MTQKPHKNYNIMLKELSDKSRRMGLKMNIAKTKVMVVDNTPSKEICLKRQVYTSSAETWTLTKQAQNKLAAAQTKVERSMLNITYDDRKTNIWVRERTKVIDITNNVRKMKWFWAGHINHLKDLACHNLETII